MTEQEMQHAKIEEYAKRILELARDTITVRLRFLDAALARLKPAAKEGLYGFATDGEKIYYDPAYILKEYAEEPGYVVRACLHMLFHCIFFHQFQYDKLENSYWDMACDIAVESMILDMDIAGAGLSRDAEAIDRLNRIRKNVPKLTAEKIYRDFLLNPPSRDMESEYKRLFMVDIHDGWVTEGENTEVVISENQWKKLTERIKTELNAFSKAKAGPESLADNLEEATRERYNYKDILERFTVMGEELTVNDDEFDYIFYTYGLNRYGNMPLIEPLEYKDVKKVKEIVIAIDTSASCRGETVKAFISRTYDILKGTENFFNKINLHIIQCDAQIQSDTKITNDEDFKEFIQNGQIKGFGSTDFRPVFEYVDYLKKEGEFENLKGLIYFTDGYGVYPEQMPCYDVIFAFLNEDRNRLPVPGWAIKVVLEDEI